MALFLAAARCGVTAAFSPSRSRAALPAATRRTLVSAAEKGGGGGGGGGGRKKKAPNPYAPSIILPTTEFGQRADAIRREPELQAYWDSTDVYGRLSRAAAASGASRYVLHDGPPYANGDLHIGHALNKLLKDFINRRKSLEGRQVHYVPGWDCHGLPIELKVLQTMKSKERRGLTPVALRARAAEFAKEAAGKQSASFRRYGVMGDFENPYLTLEKEFEAEQIGVFGSMYRNGHIYRGFKPVNWSPSSRTALAEAELEYPEGHVSKSIYVAFDVETPSDALAAHADGLRVAVWTTTPWTIPANLAVAVNPALTYAVVAHPKTGRLLVAAGLVDALAAKLELPAGEAFEVVATCAGGDLVGTTYRHPVADRVSPVLAGGDYITTESGTGLVHTAPGHGQEDYQTGLKAGLDLLSPVDDGGRFTAEAGERFAGMDVLGDGNTEVVTALEEVGALLRLEDYGHKYPYDWRTKKPTIFRATSQWFASVEGFRDEALAAADTVRWIPETGRNRIGAFVSGRGDWCISRQRSWGVPIPVFFDRETGEDVLLDDETLDHIQKIFAEHGSDAWWTMDESELLPPSRKAEAEKWRKGTDTMDVWFDSGSSWAGVARRRKELAYPADMYLEGSDQHRGWFQSSLLTSVAANGIAPYKTVLTHGFVMDEKGFKMSKSLGNVVSPTLIIEGGNNKKQQPAYGADVLRLWVASCDYTSDMCIGDGIIKQTFENYRKFRNTARYLLGNLADYDPAVDAVPYDDLPSLDKYLLGRLSATLAEVTEAFDDYQFYRATQALTRFATADLSNFYLDVAKDRLYISPTADARRRSCQTVLAACLEGFSKAVAPILPHLAEDIWQNLPYDKPTDSVFEGGLPAHLANHPPHDAQKWDTVRGIRDDINAVLEAARRDKLVGASLDAAAYVHPATPAAAAVLLDLATSANGVDDLGTVLMLSQVHVVETAGEVREACDGAYVQEFAGEEGTATVGVRPAAGKKCGRCWFYSTEVGKHGPHLDLCKKCADAVLMWEESSGEKLEVAGSAAVEV